MFSLLFKPWALFVQKWNKLSQRVLSLPYIPLLPGRMSRQERRWGQLQWPLWRHSHPGCPVQEKQKTCWSLSPWLQFPLLQDGSNNLPAVVMRIKLGTLQSSYNRAWHCGKALKMFIITVTTIHSWDQIWNLKKFPQIICIFGPFRLLILSTDHVKEWEWEPEPTQNPFSDFWPTSFIDKVVQERSQMASEQRKYKRISS